ncbi:hypothetical protein J0H58_34930 [bacterium]|nr:hypothetical protein [bacterium]
MRTTTSVLLVLALAAAGADADARPPQAWVTVSGQVVLPPDVPLPVPKLLPNGAADESILVDAKTRGVKNVVVWLRSDDQNPKSKLAPADIHPADAKRLPRAQLIRFTPLLTFEPRVLNTRVGDTLIVQNQAQVPANFFWTSGNNGNINAVIPAGQFFRGPAALAAESPPIGYKSNAVPEAVGYLRVFEHPYHAATDAEGKFELHDAPVGKYRLVYWHEKVGFKDGAKGRFGIPVEITRDTVAFPPLAFDVTK